MFRRFLIVLGCAVCLSMPQLNAETKPSTQSGWVLDEAQSVLSFVSIKAGNIAEVHRFKELTGHISVDGKATLQINTASIDTAIPIRDERMQAFLFETEIFPRIRIESDLGLETVQRVAQGKVVQDSTPAVVTLKDRTIDVQAEVLATPLANGNILVTTTKPILLNANAVGLAAGVEKLREIAGLPGISQAVPVTFTLIFDPVD